MTKMPYTALVVDDEPVVLSLIRDALEDEPLEIVTASSGEEAMEIISKQGINLLISDIRMPGMKGIELAHLARESQPEIHVIFMTGYANLGTAKDAIQQGAIDYILKPFDLAEIRQSVQKALTVINEERAGISEEKLTELSDLGQMLFASGDKRSLASSSLRFAMMQLKTDDGCIIYRTGPDMSFTLLINSGEQYHEGELSSQIVGESFDGKQNSVMLQPMLVNALQDHPVLANTSCFTEIESVPEWVTEGNEKIVVPISRPDFFYGFIVLKINEDTTSVKQANLKLLAIVANQLVTMLENAELVEESQRAYARLKEMQDETIELEKMATRGVMSAEIGHELNNFLSIVTGNLSLICMNIDKGAYEKLDGLTQKINLTVERMTRFTANLMDLGSISSKMEVVCFSELLNDVVEYLVPQKRFSGVQIQIPDHLPKTPIHADPTQMRQLLYNLFNNAADATRNCETRLIDVTLESNAKSNHLTCIIADTGVGFDSDKLDKAFTEQFTTKEDGHGFGLIVIKRIIENHGGSVNIRSLPGKGCRIEISLPLHEHALQSV